jgi:glutamate-ammonia-ligase adenylyltransferase
MIDELMDSLLLDKLPTLPALQENLTDLCRGAEDIDVILHSFKNSQHLRVGVRDVLGKEDIRATTKALSDIAEACLWQVARHQYDRLCHKYGAPGGKAASEDGECGSIILALGKLGGREPNYHSDLDVMFLYEADGTTQFRHGRRVADRTTNQHFFSQWGQQIVKRVTHLGPHGRLYELDASLRFSGTSGMLAVSLADLRRHFATDPAPLWERQALCRARPIYGSPRAQEAAMEAVREAVVGPGWRREDAAEIRHMRQRLEKTAAPRNLKRGVGGTLDVEFTVQMLQMRHAATAPSVLVPGTVEALTALHDSGNLSRDDGQGFSESYRFLRGVEARLRLMGTAARHDLPEDPRELDKLAYLLGRPERAALLEDCRRHMAENRCRFNRLFDAATR